MKAPDEAQEGSKHEMSGIHEEHFALSKSCFFKPWQQFASVKIELELMVTLAGNGCGFAEFEAEALHETPRLTFAQADAGGLLNALYSLLGISNRAGAKRAPDAREERVQRAGGFVVSIFKGGGKFSGLEFVEILDFPVGEVDFNHCLSQA